MTTDKNDPPRIGYSIREACLASSLGKTTLYAHIAAGRLPVWRVGGRTIIPAEIFRAFITGNSREEASHAAPEK